ncbi:hypothetical protein [Paucibacter sp. Y2R2-4]|uniref:hypothetical protein n=1 Tax=Paucibacter sp. Y2R2-4 TaxID=2893553 RepID=UPI0021E45EE6|nr:hypothetical protein [Paucibacter sp. Y2R2-4]MCV2350801.1 hypothetical protein [Paucibacter sp. Y2R2-4]
MSTVRRDFRSVPFRDASATWTAIVDLLGGSSSNVEARAELMSVAGIAASVITDQSPKASPIVVTCDGPRTRIYCLFDDESLETSAGNEAKLGFDALKGDWQVSLPVAAEDLSWVAAALKKSGSHVVARDAASGIATEAAEKGSADTEVELDLEGFLKL